MARVKTIEGLANAVKHGESEIVIEGDLASKVEAIKNTASSSWLTALGFISFSAFSLQLSEKATKEKRDALAAQLMESPGAKIAVGILGDATEPAIALALAARGIGVLFDLRLKYELSAAGKTAITLRLA